MDPQIQSRIVDRIHEISRELGLLEPLDLTSGWSASKHSLEDVEELYAEREHLMQELKQDC